jgi:hypothetical protein
MRRMKNGSKALVLSALLLTATTAMAQDTNYRSDRGDFDIGWIGLLGLGGLAGLMRDRDRDRTKASAGHRI